MALKFQQSMDNSFHAPNLKKFTLLFELELVKFNQIRDSCLTIVTKWTISVFSAGIKSLTTYSIKSINYHMKLTLQKSKQTSSNINVDTKQRPMQL
jgi:hypothetical protein